MRTHPHFIPNHEEGSRQDTAVLLVGTAKEFGIDQRDIASTHSGFYITDRLASVLYDESVEQEPKPKAKAAKKTTATKKTSGNRAEKNDSEKGK